MKTFCTCNCERTRHRPRGFKPFTGSCYDCHCSAMRPARFELFRGERRILGCIGKAGRLGIEEIRTELAEDPAIGALEAILRNLFLAAFLTFEPQLCVAVTVAGRTYLQEHPSNG